MIIPALPLQPGLRVVPGGLDNPDLPRQILPVRPDAPDPSTLPSSARVNRGLVPDSRATNRQATTKQTNLAMATGYRYRPVAPCTMHHVSSHRNSRQESMTNRAHLKTEDHAGAPSRSFEEVPG